MRYSSCVHRVLVAASLLCFVVLPAAALDPGYLSELPDPTRIARDFQGTDRLDTLALQVAALTRLNRLVTEMAGDRYYTPGKFPTPDETRAIAAIRAAATPLGAEAEATFDPKARGADTPRAQWRQKVAAYERGDELYTRLMQLYFSPAFRDAHGAKLAEIGAAQRAGREAIERGGRELRGEREVRVESHAFEIWVGVAALALLVLGSFKLLRAPTISAKTPYRFRVGLARYTIDSASGAIANYTHREVIGKLPRSDYNPIPNYRPPSFNVTLEAYEDFTLDDAGRSEPIHLASFYPGAGPLLLKDVGHRRTALWTTIGGQRRYLLVKGPRIEGPHPACVDTVAQLFPRPTWTVAPALVLGFVVGDLVVASEYSGALAVFVALAVWGGLMKFLIWHRSDALGTQLVALGKRLYEAAYPPQ